ncbi:MAG: efflux RND transporter periplasmic adaptor subunit [Rhodospirillales bacterium]|nr:efflux RND transporter periplasmic adaptor subunit [Rhodospirillales bacterium]
MNKSYMIAAVIALCSAVWVISGLVSSSDPAGGSKEETAVESSGPALMKVRVQESVALPMVDDIVITGRTKASRTVELRAETDGKITGLLAEKGALVEEGQVLARLDERDRKARLEEARERVNQRQIEYNAAKSLENKGFNSKIRLAQARADLESARAVLKNAEIELANIEIKAPFAGVLNTQDIEIGDYVEKGQLLYSIVDLNPVELSGYISEQKVGLIKAGTEASAILTGNRAIKGEVSFIASAADPDTRTFAIEMTADNPDYVIVEGLTAEIHIPAREKKAHQISPAIIALNDAGEIGVKVVDDKDTVRFVSVNVLANTPDYMWVTGLPDKARLITIGQDFVLEGQQVDPRLVNDKEGDL